ncbi:MAG: CPBP family intramembrane metalloprotease [Polyangiaceae bacterium]|nr:CPBP family intramembrane metalloprotease [Polyangiaceae bacterium]
MQRPLSRGASLAIVIVVVTALVTVASYVAPDAYATTAVAAIFLGATYILVLRHDAEVIRAHGLSLGGIFEPERIDLGRVLKATVRALVVAAIVFTLIVVPFWYGYRSYNHFTRPFAWRAAMPGAEEVLAQIFVIALPEEAFYRGYVQSRLDELVPGRVTILSLPLTLSLVVTSILFAVCHVLTITNPARLAVFFPSLLFGALRAREGGIGASVLLHAACNLLTATLARGYAH